MISILYFAFNIFQMKNRNKYLFKNAKISGIGEKPEAEQDETKVTWSRLQ